MGLKGNDESLRNSAIVILSKLHDKRTVDLLIFVLRNDKNDGVRCNAVWALRKLGNKDSIKVRSLSCI